MQQPLHPTWQQTRHAATLPAHRIAARSILVHRREAVAVRNGDLEVHPLPTVLPIRSLASKKK
jgi:hypothetical protein